MGVPIKYIGKSYNYLYVLDQKRENNKTYLYCQCKLCNTKKWIRADTVTSGKQVSCGCYNKKYNYLKVKDIAGQKFGLLTAKYPTDKRDPHNSSVIWVCVCECGGSKKVSVGDLTRARVASCGCLAKEWQVQQGKTIGEQTRQVSVEGTNIRNLTMRTPKRNTSGHKGVSWDKERKKWAVQIGFKGKNYHLGRYSNLKDAVKARKEAEEKIFGNFLEWYYYTYKPNKGDEDNG